MCDNSLNQPNLTSHIFYIIAAHLRECSRAQLRHLIIKATQTISFTRIRTLANGFSAGKFQKIDADGKTSGRLEYASPQMYFHGGWT